MAARIPVEADAHRDIVFIVRAGALFPYYRTSSLLEQLKGKVHVPAILFYPGELDGASGVAFYGRIWTPNITTVRKSSEGPR